MTFLNSYGISCNDCLLSTITLFSAAPYSKRHWELSNDPTQSHHRLGHRVIAVLEAIPVVGLVFALIERIVSLVRDKFFSPPQQGAATQPPATLTALTARTSGSLIANGKVAESHINASSSPAVSVTASTTSDVANQVLASTVSAIVSSTLPINPPREAESKTAASELPAVSDMTSRVNWGRGFPLTPEESFKELVEESQRAFEPRQHAPGFESDAKAVYATVTEGLPSLDDLNSTEARTRLTFSLQVHRIGKKGRNMIGCEDKTFHHETSRYILTGVCDGHGGAETSEYVSKEFPSLFEETLKEVGADVFRALEEAIQKIHEKFLKVHSDKDRAGSTAVISYIDKVTNKIYTANIGDSGASLYRKFDDGYLNSRNDRTIFTYCSPKVNEK